MSTQVMMFYFGTQAKMLNNVWRSSQYGTRSKLKIYHSCVLSTLLCGSEGWRMTESDLRTLSTFHTKSLRKILRILWPKTISNKDLLIQCEQKCIGTISMQRRWRWIRHAIRRERDSVSKTALHWTVQAGQTSASGAEMRSLGHSWGSIQTLAGDRELWRSCVLLPCVPVGMTGSEWVSEWVSEW